MNASTERYPTVWLKYSSEWRLSLTRSGESPESAERIIARMRPLFDILGTGPRAFEDVIRDVLQERLAAEIANETLYGPRTTH